MQASASSQSLRICSYNLLDGPINATDDQNFRVVIEAIGNQNILGNQQAIDILAFQEGPASQGEYDDIENNFETVFGSDYESSITPPDFGGCRTGFVYNTQTVTLLGSISLTSGFTHNVRRCHFRPVGGGVDDEFYIYSLHLKAGTSSSDANEREAEAMLLRNNADTLPAGSNIIYAGDFNIKGSFEDAYSVMRATGSNSTGLESLNAPFGFQPNADWEENEAMQPFHTQSPQNNMDDRFDFFLLNEPLFDGSDFEFVVGSTTALGNNGSHTMNAGINTGNGTAGFGSELVAFSDHLPVICDFKFDQRLPASSQPISATAQLTRTVRTTGPVGGTSGDVFLNIEGTDHPGFESFAVVDFDLTGNPAAGTAVEDVVLNMLQSNAGFSANGPIGIYVATNAAAQIPIDGSIQYVAGQNELDCVPAVLSNGALKVATYASIHRSNNGLTYPNGTQDPIVLFGNDIGPAILDSLAGNGLLRILIVPDEAATAATFAGFASALGQTQLTANIVDDNPVVTDTYPNSFVLSVGTQGSGGLPDLVDSDDVAFRFFSAAQTNVDDISIEVSFSAPLPTDDPQTLSVTVESRVNTPNLERTIEMFDFANSQWDTIDTSTATTADDTATFQLAGDLTRYVGPANLVLTRITWKATGPVIMFPWATDIDVLKWTASE